MEPDYDPTYHARRAEEALGLAAKALGPDVRLIHDHLASRHAEMALRARPALRLVTAPKSG